MNEETKKRLRNNPHYKPLEPIVEYGAPPVHNSSIEIHPVIVVKRKRKKKWKSEI